VQTIGRRLASLVTAAATALVIVAVAIPLFLNPVWVAFEQGRTQATAWTGFDEAQLQAATDSILHDLVIGPPSFDVAVGDEPVLDERERQHMRDVRGVFIGFFAVTLLAGLTVVAVAIGRRKRPAGRLATWRAVRNGAIGLIVGIVVVGGFALVAFDALFETFHRLLFPSGSYSFDPTTERLVQLFPFAFWQESAIALGAVCIVLAAIVAAVAGRRARAVSRAALAARGGAPAGGGTNPEPVR
jgi:integral membrane protein (TIGR01906 family)